MTRSTGSAITIWEAGYLIYSYCEVGEIDFNRIKELDLSEGTGFYQGRMDNKQETEKPTPSVTIDQQAD